MWVTEIGYNAFLFSSVISEPAICAIENIYYDGTIDDWCSIIFDGIDANPMRYANNFYILNENGEYMHFDKKYSTITELTISDAFDSVGDYVFVGFKSLTSVIRPNTISTIGTCSFFNCKNLENLVFEGIITSIGESAFAYCSSLTTFGISEGIIVINSATFMWCTGLTSILIPNSVEEIGEYAFDHCDSLNTILFAGTIEEWNINVGINNDQFNDATVYYYSETSPETSGNFWHYDGNNNPVVWGD